VFLLRQKHVWMNAILWLGRVREIEAIERVHPRESVGHLEMQT
jgi:hypothetical protein